MAADSRIFTIRSKHQRQGVPADEALIPPFDVAVTGIVRLLLSWNRVDIRSARRKAERYSMAVGSAQHLAQDILCPFGPFPRENLLDGFEPLFGFFRIGVSQTVQASLRLIN